MSIAFWFGFALLMALQYIPPDPRNFWPSLGSMMIRVVIEAPALALWSPPIFYLVGKYLGARESRFRYVLLWSLGVLPFLVLQSSILWAVLPVPGGHSLHTWVDLIRGDFADQVFIYISVVVAAHGYHYLKRLRREERELYEYQQALAASELQALKMQLQPHFLFNTLHGISTLVDSDPRSARAMIVKLSNLLRAALDRDGSDLIPLQDELKFAREYLDLEKMRFGERLKIDWQVAPETHRSMVPPMILQPLLENAIRHGVASTREGGWIEITAGALNGTLTIRLRNSVGDKTPNGAGVGLRNAEARLKYLYAGDASLRLAVAQDHIATVILTLPMLSSQPAVRQERQLHIRGEREDHYASSYRG